MTEQAQPPEPRLSAPLRRPAFRRLASAYVFNELGNWLGEIALAVIVFDRTRSALATAALFLSARFVPGLVAPALVARLDRRGLTATLATLYASEALLVLTLAALAERFALPAILAIAALDGVLAAAARTFARVAIAGLLRPAGELRAGNAVLNIGYTAVSALGPAAAGVIVAVAGSGTALAADAASFALVAAIVAATRGIDREAPAEAEPWRGRLSGALEHVRASTPLRLLLAGQALTTVFLTLVIPIEVVFAKQTLGAGDAGFGALLAAWGVGMALGGIAFARLRGGSLWTLLVASTVAMGLSYLATATAPTLAAACAAAAVGGTGNGIQWVALISAVQELAAGPFEARVLALFEAVASATPGVGFVLGGVLTALTGPRLSYAVAGTGVLGLSLTGAVWLWRWRARGGVPERARA